MQSMRHRQSLQIYQFPLPSMLHRHIRGRLQTLQASALRLWPLSPLPSRDCCVLPFLQPLRSGIHTYPYRMALSPYLRGRFQCLPSGFQDCRKLAERRWYRVLVHENGYRYRQTLYRWAAHVRCRFRRVRHEHRGRQQPLTGRSHMLRCMLRSR